MTMTPKDERLAAAREASAWMTSQGIRHMLVGALAVTLHGGWPCAGPVEFMVCTEAGPVASMRAPIRVGRIPVRAIPLPNEPYLMAELGSPLMLDGLPVISMPALVAMLMDSGRRRDRETAHGLIAVHASRRRVAQRW